MNTKVKDKNNLLNTSTQTLFMELVNVLLAPSPKKLWLLKVINLLKQYLNAESVSLNTYSDNIFVSTDFNVPGSKESFSLKSNQACVDRLEPYWLGNVYTVPVNHEGCLQVVWDKVPSSLALSDYENIFSLLACSLKNRNDLFCQSRNLLRQDILSKLENILASESDLKNKLSLVAHELSLILGVSRIQIKVFSADVSLVFENSLNVEVADKLFLDAISVVSSIEQSWLENLKNGNILDLNKSQFAPLNGDSSDLDLLLSIKSIFGCPLIYREKAVGVIVLHQCDYERMWKEEEILLLKEIALLLGVVIGTESDFEKKYKEVITDASTGLINSDEFLRELNRLQVETQISNSYFSLIMIDIEKLRDINLEFGFVGGNLVLSHTARYLKRIYGNKYKIARYSNDEFVIILKNIDRNAAKTETEKLKDGLSNLTVLGIGPIDYNFSFVTFPTHGDTVASLLTLLEQAMLLSKSRGTSQISSYDEIKGVSRNTWRKLMTIAVPEIIMRKSSLKTGPVIYENIQAQCENQRNNYSADILDSIQSLALALDAKDSYTEGHSKRVAEYALMLAKNLSLDVQEIEWIRLAATMHDIGKIGIPENILCKPDKLTKEEYEIMKKHPVVGARILKPIKPLEKVANLVLYHHEYWDGSGYPRGLSKEEIPFGARIVSIVDAFQAMTSSRPYRNALPFEEAVKRLKLGKEKQWDPALVEMFLDIVSS